MSITNPVNLAPVLADQTSVLKADVAAALSELLTEHNSGQTALATSLTDILAKIALESDQNEALINALSTVSGEIDSSVQTIQNSFVGELKALNVDDIGGLYENGAEHWLKTGVIETDINLYPLAKVGTVAMGTYIEGGQFDDTDLSSAYSYVYANGKLYISVSGDSSINHIRVYNADFSFTGITYNLSTETGQTHVYPQLTHDGTNFYTADYGDDKVRKWSNTFDFLGVEFTLPASANNPKSIFWDEAQQRYVTTALSQGMLYFYSRAGAALGSFDVNAVLGGGNVYHAMLHDGFYYVHSVNSMHQINPSTLAFTGVILDVTWGENFTAIEGEFLTFSYRNYNRHTIESYDYVGSVLELNKNSNTYHQVPTYVRIK